MKIFSHFVKTDEWKLIFQFISFIGYHCHFCLAFSSLITHFCNQRIFLIYELCFLLVIWINHTVLSFDGLFMLYLKKPTQSIINMRPTAVTTLFITRRKIPSSFFNFLFYSENRFFIILCKHLCLHFREYCFSIKNEYFHHKSSKTIKIERKKLLLIRS